MLEPRRAESPRNVLRGILLVVRGRRDGMGQFGASREAVLAALAPIAAFLIVGALLGVAGGGVRGLTGVAAISIGLLAPLVLSFEAARWLGRAAEWPRFAAAFCWCQWAAPLVLIGMLMLMTLLMAGGVSGDAAELTAVLVTFAYGLWLNWFLARHALQISPWRAVAVVATVNLLTGALIMLPQVADYLVNGAPPS